MHAYSMRLRPDENIICRHDRLKKSAWGVCWTTAPLCISAKPAAGRRTKFTCSTVRRRQISHPESPARLYFNHGKYSNYSLSTNLKLVCMYVCMYTCMCVKKFSQWLQFPLHLSGQEAAGEILVPRITRNDGNLTLSDSTFSMTNKYT